MSEDMNRIILVGRLVRDNELSYTQAGKALSKMTIAVKRRVKSGDQWIEEASFFDITLWGKRGEALTNYLTKGQQIAVDGKLKQERWEKDGQKRSRVVVEASNIQLLGGQSQGASKPQQSNEPFTDDVPFM